MFRHKYGLYNPYEKPIQGLFEIDPNHPMSQYLGAYWPLNGSRFDKKNQYNLTLGSALTWAPTGLNFPGGANSTTKIATFPSLNLGTVHTLCVRLSLTAVSGFLFTGSANYYAFNLFNGTAIYYSAGNSNSVYVAYTTALNVPTNFAIVRNDTNVDFYVNAVKIGTTKTLASNNALVLTTAGGYAAGSNLINTVLEYAAFFNIADINIVKQMHADPYAMLRPIGRGRLWSVSSVLITKDCVFPVNVTKTLSQDSQSPVNSMKNLSIDNQSPVNFTKSLSAESQINIDLVKRLQIESGLNIQFLKFIAHDDQIIVNLVYGEGAIYFISATATFPINLIKTIAQNSEIPFDFIDGFLFKAVLAMMSLKKPSASMSLKKPGTSFDLIGD